MSYHICFNKLPDTPSPGNSPALTVKLTPVEFHGGKGFGTVDRHEFTDTIRALTISIATVGTTKAVGMAEKEQVKPVEQNTSNSVPDEPKNVQELASYVSNTFILIYNFVLQNGSFILMIVNH